MIKSSASTSPQTVSPPLSLRQGDQQHEDAPSLLSLITHPRLVDEDHRAIFNSHSELQQTEKMDNNVGVGYQHSLPLRPLSKCDAIGMIDDALEIMDNDIIFMNDVDSVSPSSLFDDSSPAAFSVNDQRHPHPSVNTTMIMARQQNNNRNDENDSSGSRRSVPPRQ